MGDASTDNSFWSGPTKFIAGLAALVTALTGLAAALTGAGLIGGDSETPTPVVEVRTTTDLITTDEREQIDEPAEPSPTSTPVPAPVEPSPDPGPERGVITVEYFEPRVVCDLNIEIEIGDTWFLPIGNSFTVRDVQLGPQSYWIGGTIDCGLDGQCVASGTGTVAVIDQASYNVVWDWDDWDWDTCIVALV